MKRLARRTAIIFGAAALGGCATVGSSNIAASGAPEADRAGIAYFLPRQLTKVTVKRTAITFDKAIEQLGKDQLAAAAAKAAVASTKASIKETEDLIVARGDIVPVRELLMARLEAQKKALPVAEEALTKADKKVVDAKADVAAAMTRTPDEQCGAFKVLVNLELLPPIPDPAHGYRLSPRHSVLRDDEHKLKVSGGLLDSVDVVAADRTADILVELATLAGAATGARILDEPCPGEASEELSAVADLADPVELASLNEVIGKFGAKLDVKNKGWTRSATYPDDGKWLGGIAYRTPVDVMIHIRKCEYADGKCASDKEWKTAQILALSLPQAGPISYVRQDAGMLTKTKYSTAFKHGILTSYDSNRPSEVLEVARTPMRMVNGFFDGASKIVSLRTGRADKETALANSETARLKAENDRLIAALAGQTQLSAAQLSTEEALLRDRSRRDAINRCIGEKVTAGESYASCLALP